MKRQILSGLMVLITFSIQAQWGLNGNGGTNPAVNFLGTTDNADLVLKRWGAQSGLLNPTNTAFGVSALNPATTGTYNTAVGVATLTSNTSGLFNTGIGFNALLYNSSGYFNTATGGSALFSNTAGSSNIASGFNAMFNNSTGSYNTAHGHEVLYLNTSGNYNNAYGYAAGGDVSTGSNNTFIGSNTGRGITTGSNNTIIGNNVTGLPAALYNTIILADGSGNQRIYVDDNGKVRIGSTSLTLPGTYKLYVEDGILTEKVKVAVKTSGDWADYVFHKNYPLMPLPQLNSFIQTNGHLPGVPSAEEVVKEGIDLGKMDAKLLEKIEELTLYILDLKKENETMKQRLSSLEKDARK